MAAADLLSAIYLRLTSAYDRARFAAVCTSWCAAAAWHPRLPALPLLLPYTGYDDQEALAYSPEDGRVVRVPLPCLHWGNRLVGSYGDGWIATTSGYDGLIIANFFSGARMALRTDGIDFQKIVFSEYPSSSGCILAGITRSGCIALRRVGCAEARWTYDTDGCFEDIIFSNGKLYGFAAFADTILLCQFDIGVDKDGDPVTILVYSRHIVLTALRVAEVSSVVVKHIFELHGKLAIAVKIGYGRKTRHFFRVFKLVGEHTWAEVISLRDHTLFLGPACCKAMHVSTAGRRSAVEGNRIYYFDQNSYNPDEVECLIRKIGHR